MKSIEKMLKCIIWERSYTSSSWLILLFCAFAVGFKNAFASKFLLKEERKRCISHREDYLKGVQKMPV